MKKEYIAPDVELVMFDPRDIITSSLDSDQDPYAEDIFTPIE